MLKAANRRRTFSLLGASLLLAVAGCAGTPSTRVLSHGPVYYGERPVARVYVYFFIDMRPEYMPEAFRRVAGAKLAEALTSSGIPNEQLWFSDTGEGSVLESDFKNHTLTNTTFVSVGATIDENAERDHALAPTHRLIVFPREALTTGAGGHGQPYLALRLFISVRTAGSDDTLPIPSVSSIACRGRLLTLQSRHADPIDSQAHQLRNRWKLGSLDLGRTTSASRASWQILTPT